MFCTFSVPQSSPRVRQGAARGRACDVCRKFKIKCEVEKVPKGCDQPSSNSCIPCRKARVKCTYNDKPAKRGRPWKQSGQAVTSVPNPPEQSSSPKSLIIIDASSAIEAKPDSIDKKAPNASHIESANDSLASGSLETPVSSHLPSPPTPPTHVVPLEVAQDFLPENPSIQYEDHVWGIINNFFDTMYLIFPVVDYDAVVSKLIMDTDWRSDTEFHTLLYSLNLFHVSAQHRMQQRDPLELTLLARQVEQSRLGYDFADPATLNSVVISLALFTAYNVLEKHNRAFLYLDEAITLFAAIPGPLTDEEEIRKQRVGQVLYNTESATLAIYATETRRQHQRAPKPLIQDEDPANMTGSERHIALHLLDQLTRVHLADDADQMSLVRVESDPTKITPPAYDDASSGHLRYWRLQSADVAITLQWQLSRMLLGINRSTSTSDMSQRARLGHLGVTAMSWICSLSEGDLRIVGLGKIAGLALNISMMANSSWQQDVLRGLTNAVIREDHENTFGFLLDHLIVPSIPTALPSPQVTELSRWWDFNAPIENTFTPLSNSAIDQRRGFVEELNDDVTQEAVPIIDPMSSTLAEALDPENFQWFAL